MAKKTILGFFRDQLSRVPPVHSKDLTGKTVVVIGANTGIGYEAAAHFAKQGAGRLVLGCRSRARGEDALKRLDYAKAELRLVDLASFKSVADFAASFGGDEQGIDILVLNAAVNQWKTANWTADGWETTLQVNDLAPFYLAFLLLPTLHRASARASSPARLVVVASDTHYWTEFDEEALSAPKIYEKLNDKEYCKSPKAFDARRYFDTKLLNVLFVRALPALLPGTTAWLVPTSVNPGLCASELSREVAAKSRLNRLAVKVVNATIARTAEQGARQLVYAALAEGEALKGGYVNRARVEEPSDFVVSDKGREVAKRAWDETLEILGKVDGSVGKILKEY